MEPSGIEPLTSCVQSTRLAGLPGATDAAASGPKSVAPQAENGAERYSELLLRETRPFCEGGFRAKKTWKIWPFLNGSDGTRTRDLRRDRPAL